MATPDQTTQILTTLGDIRESQGRIEQKIDSHLADDQAVHDRQDAALSGLNILTTNNSKSLARIKGWGSGAAAVCGALITLIGFDSFGS